MKRLWCFVLLMFAFVGIYGQTRFTGTIKPVKQEGKLNIVFDYSEASIHGMTEEEFAEFEKDWVSDQAQVYSDMIEEIQKKVKAKLSVGHFKNAKYTMKIHVFSVSVRGDFTCEANIYDENNNTIASVKNIYAKGGKFGSALNLIKDGAETLGEILGSVLKRELSKVK